MRILVAAILAALAAQDPTPQPTFRSKTSAVMVDVTVSDRTGRPVTGLESGDFEILDNGVAQQVTEVSYGKLPIDVTVALDVSHSVSGNLIDRLRQAIVQLMGDLAKGDRLRLTLFNTRVTRTMDYTTDIKAVERAIRAASAGGGTALFDAISVTLVSSSPADRRQLAVFFTDGSDSSSTTAPELLTSVAQRTRATLAFVVPSSAAPPTVTLPTVTRGMITDDAGHRPHRGAYPQPTPAFLTRAGNRRHGPARREQRQPLGHVPLDPERVPLHVRPLLLAARR